MNGSFCNIFSNSIVKKSNQYKYNLVNSTQNNGSKFTAVTSCGYILQCTLWNLALVLWQLLEHTFVLIRETPLVDRLFFVDWWFFFFLLPKWKKSKVTGIRPSSLTLNKSSLPRLDFPFPFGFTQIGQLSGYVHTQALEIRHCSVKKKKKKRNNASTGNGEAHFL